MNLLTGKIAETTLSKGFEACISITLMLYFFSSPNAGVAINVFQKCKSPNKYLTKIEVKERQKKFI